VSRKASRKLPDVSSAIPAELVRQMEADAGMGLPTDPEESREMDEMPDPLSGPAFGPTLLEQLLFSIITAHPGSAKTNRERLNAAMKALTGKASSGNPLADDSDDRALLWMKRKQLELRRSGAEPSDRSLAIKAAEKFTPRFNAELDMSPADRLREKFSGTYDKKKAMAKFRKSGQRTMLADVRETLAYRVSHHDYLVESIERQILRRIAAELCAAGVALSLPDE
jgi:hypothetical protein